MTTMITVWPVLGIEVSADRGRTWVACAAVDTSGPVVVELLDLMLGLPETVVPM